MTVRQRQQPVSETKNPNRRWNKDDTLERTKRKSVDDDEDTMNQLLDEDEQESLIRQIHNDYVQQSQRLEWIFTILCCYIVPLLSLLYTILLIYQESKPSQQHRHSHNQSLLSLRWIHLILNSIIHWYIPKGIFRNVSSEYHVSTKKEMIATVSHVLWYGVYVPYGLTCFITAVAHWMMRQPQQSLLLTTTNTETKMYHLILWITATLFLGSAVYIQQDHHNFLHHRIHDLQANKYSYKSL